MNTMLVGLAATSASTISRTWPAISAGVRLRRNPIRPVAQNTQPRAHPTRDEIHNVRRLPAGVSNHPTPPPSADGPKEFSLPVPQRLPAGRPPPAHREGAPHSGLP